MKTEKYYVVMSKPESGLAILGVDSDLAGAKIDARQNCRDVSRHGLTFEVSEELREEIEDRGDAEDLCFKVLGEGKVVA